MIHNYCRSLQLHLHCVRGWFVLLRNRIDPKIIICWTRHGKNSQIQQNTTFAADRLLQADLPTVIFIEWRWRYTQSEKKGQKETGITKAWNAGCMHKRCLTIIRILHSFVFIFLVSLSFKLSISSIRALRSTDEFYFYFFFATIRSAPKKNCPWFEIAWEK